MAFTFISFICLFSFVPDAVDVWTAMCSRLYEGRASYTTESNHSADLRLLPPSQRSGCGFFSVTCHARLLSPTRKLSLPSKDVGHLRFI